MRVVLIHQAFVAPDEAGGTRHYELAKRAVESGIQFTVVASDISYLTGQRAIAVDGKEYAAAAVEALNAFRIAQNRLHGYGIALARDFFQLELGGRLPFFRLVLEGDGAIGLENGLEREVGPALAARVPALPFQDGLIAQVLIVEGCARG